MRRFPILISLAILLLACARVNGQDAPRAEIFGGYQFFHANSGVTFSGFDSFNLNGWDASLSGYFNRYLGITSDFSGVYGTPSITIPGFGSTGINTHLYTYMFGPTLRVANPSPLQPFARVLIGGASLRGSVNIPVVGVSASSSDDGFAWDFGGGVDYKFLPFIALRPIQIDFVQTHIGGNSQNHFRYALGAVLRF